MTETREEEKADCLLCVSTTDDIEWLRDFHALAGAKIAAHKSKQRAEKFERDNSN